MEQPGEELFSLRSGLFYSFGGSLTLWDSLLNFKGTSVSSYSIGPGFPGTLCNKAKITS